MSKLTVRHDPLPYWNCKAQAYCHVLQATRLEVQLEVQPALNTHMCVVMTDHLRRRYNNPPPDRPCRPGCQAPLYPGTASPSRRPPSSPGAPCTHQVASSEAPIRSVLQDNSNSISYPASGNCVALPAVLATELIYSVDREYPQNGLQVEERERIAGIEPQQ